MIPFFFFCLIALARIYSTTLNRSAESEHPGSIPDLREKAFISLLCMLLAVGLSHMAFITLRDIYSMPNLLSIFIMYGCVNLSNVFHVSIEFEHMIPFPFILLM